MAGLWDFSPTSLFAGGGSTDPNSPLNGMLTPQDRLMAIFAGLSKAGAGMSQPGMSKSQALAAGFGGLGEGIQGANQAALIQKLTGMKLADAKREMDDKKILSDAFAGASSITTPAPVSVAEPGQSVAQAMQNRINSGNAATAGNARADLLKNPAVQGALLRLHGPAGLAALQKEDDPSKRYTKLGEETVIDLKAEGGPKVVLTVAQPKTDIGRAIKERDALPAGDPQRALYDAAINKHLTDSGFRFTPTGMAPLPGGSADPRYKATVAGAEADARVPAALRQAAGMAPIEVAKAEAMPFNLEPGASRFRGSPLNLLPGGNIPASVPRIGQPAPPKATPVAAAPLPPPAATPSAAASPPAQVPGMPQPIATNTTQMWSPDPVNPRVQVSVTGERKEMPGAKDLEEEKKSSESALIDTDRMIGSVNDLLTHPGRKAATGMSSAFNFIPGTDAYGFKAKLETLKAQTFLPEVQKMKGMGALSNAEGDKITAAFQALDPGMPEAEFEASLKGALRQMVEARERFAKRAHVTPQAEPGGMRTFASPDEMKAAKLPTGTAFFTGRKLPNGTPEIGYAP